MKIYYLSDLHIEYGVNKNFFSNLKKYNKDIKDSILILAGDIHNFSDILTDSTLRKLTDLFKHTYIIAGNHEFYNGKTDISILLESFEHTSNNITLLNNKVVTINGVDLIFSSMFTEITPQNSYWISRKMNDFYRIKFNENHFTTDNYNEIYKNALTFIKDKAFYSKNCIIISHHLPSFISLNPYYKNDILNEAFSAELSDFILDNQQIKAWIFGHTHYNTYQSIGNTKLLTNQVGYYTENMIGFEYNSFIEI